MTDGQISNLKKLEAIKDTAKGVPDESGQSMIPSHILEVGMYRRD